jgi:hypothetical protein
MDFDSFSVVRKKNKLPYHEGSLLLVKWIGQAILDCSAMKSIYIPATIMDSSSITCIELANNTSA